MQKGKVLKELLIAETKRRLFEESIPRLRKCLQEVSEEDVWLRPNDQSNSIGNLVLHLCGNARQWIVTGLGKAPDIRQRNREFNERGPIAKKELLTLVDTLPPDIEKVLDDLTVADLVGVHPVQGFQESGVSILVHVIEHFSYHVGQIAYYVKARKGIDLGFYEDVELG